MSRTKKYAPRISVSDGRHSVDAGFRRGHKHVIIRPSRAKSNVQEPRHEPATSARHCSSSVRAGSRRRRRGRAALLDYLRELPFEDLGFARVDHHRAARQGFPEVILGIGKTPAQIAAIAERIVGARPDAARHAGRRRRPSRPCRQVVPGAVFHETRALIDLAGRTTSPPGRGTVLVAAAGTVGPAGGRGGGRHGRADGQRGGPALRRRRGRHPPPARAHEPPRLRPA